MSCKFIIPTDATMRIAMNLTPTLYSPALYNYRQGKSRYFHKICLRLALDLTINASLNNCAKSVKHVFNYDTFFVTSLTLPPILSIYDL
ncbi:hypothetical protein DQQ10_24120 [Pseudochryseolinea flava]|uniref:Uncharacterized protein n=1 Tax=Pseudochryseolinea flava TaxID=2059302 RepID=A0A364XWR7_9BACT|nr:hypothetical protein DQQ10_24120 [Pseudochryseolinea flava]